VTVTSSSGTPERWEFKGGQTVTDVPIVGVSAANSSPTRITQMTLSPRRSYLEVTWTYTWDFGDQHWAVGAQVTHRYAKIGTYTATVTATNSLGSSTAITLVIIEPIKLHIRLLID